MKRRNVYTYRWIEHFELPHQRLILLFSILVSITSNGQSLSAMDRQFAFAN
jgi:hypothetical protein